tara:strand:+ start:540 stop:695 length:156 start_codon:yes stop_codon:yes gene_type:complete
MRVLLLSLVLLFSGCATTTGVLIGGAVGGAVGLAVDITVGTAKVVGSVITD